MRDSKIELTDLFSGGRIKVDNYTIAGQIEVKSPDGKIDGCTILLSGGKQFTCRESYDTVTKMLNPDTCPLPKTMP